MSFSQKISDDFIKAMKAGDKNKVSVLRLVKSSIKNSEIDSKKSLTDDEVSAVIRSFVKRAKESIEQYSKAGRSDLAEKEKEELAVLEEYLPKQLDHDEVRKIIDEVIRDEGASGLKDMGKVMKASMARLKGQSDGKTVNSLVKEMLEA